MSGSERYKVRTFNIEVGKVSETTADAFIRMLKQEISNDFDISFNITLEQRILNLESSFNALMNIESIIAASNILKNIIIYKTDKIHKDHC